MTLDEIKAAAEARANADCQTGLDDLEAKAEHATEYAVSGDATGKRLMSVGRASLIGMRDHLRRSIEIQRTRDGR